MTNTTRTLCGFFTVLCAAAPLGGCVIDSGGDEGSMGLSWILEDDRGVRTTCTEAGANTVRLDLLNLDTEDAYTFDFACRDKGGRTTGLVPGEYRVSLSLLTVDAVVLSALDFPRTFFVRHNQLVDLGLVVFETVPADQFFHLTWSIERQGTGMPLSCAAANASTVELVTTLGAAAPVVYEFDCAIGQGTTTTVEPGSYAITVNLLDPAAKVLSTASMGGVAVAAGHPVELPPIIFDVAP